ncbi:hypothetical protein GQX74_012891 [Glossina fuscipes]|nr:hypothetical protein GQX74_012891 [Glossina fuscipes]
MITLRTYFGWTIDAVAKIVKYKKRLYNLTRKLINNDKKLLKYDSEIRHLIREGLAERRCRNEYLCQLRSILRNRNGSSKDVLLLHEDSKPRLLWRLKLVKQTYQCRDGLVRACDIQLQNQQVLKRPVQLLYALEISRAGAEDVENNV